MVMHVKNPSNNLPMPVLGAGNSEGGAAHVHVASDARGDFPENNYQPIVINAAQAALASFPSIQWAHSLYFEVWALTGETVTVTSLDEGGNELGGIPVYHWDNATPGTIIQATDLGLGQYSFVGTMNVAGLVFTKSGSANAMKISGQMSGAS